MRIFPSGLALFAICDADRRVTVFIALNQPFKAEVDQRRRVDQELDGRDGIGIGRRSFSLPCAGGRLKTVRKLNGGDEAGEQQSGLKRLFPVHPSSRRLLHVGYALA
jgi:hypothetical protein